MLATKAQRLLSTMGARRNEKSRIRSVFGILFRTPAARPDLSISHLQDLETTMNAFLARLALICLERR